MINEIYEDTERLRDAALRFMEQTFDSPHEDLKKYVDELQEAIWKTQTWDKSTLSPNECAAALASHLEQRMNLNGALSGLATGFTRLDDMLDGLQLGEVTILASRPSIGKSAIACNIVDRVCLTDGIPTLFLSLEMSASALCRRMLSSNQRIPMNDLKSGRFTDKNLSQFAAFDALLKKSPLFIHESFGSMGAFEASGLIRKYAKRDGVKLVVLDYLQKLKAENKHEKRTYEIAETSALITSAVRDSGVAMLCLAQLNRESERDKGRTPRLSDLADSGQIERDADTVLLLHRDRNKPYNEAFVIISKQRDGETGAVKLFFDGRYCRFTKEDRVVSSEDVKITKQHNDP